jgi:hypothetical protein
MSNALEALRQNVGQTGLEVLDFLPTIGIERVIDLSNPYRFIVFQLRCSQKKLTVAGTSGGFGAMAFEARLSHTDSEQQNNALGQMKKEFRRKFILSGYSKVRSVVSVSQFVTTRRVYERVEVSIAFKFVADIPCRYKLEWACL